jgi:hypothetical protein
MITFYYEISKLIDRAQIESLLFVKAIENKDTGLPALEEIAISDDDEQFIRKILLKAVANEIYGTLSPYSRTLSDLDTPLEGFEYEATYTPDEGDPVDDCIIFRIIMPTYFDEEMVSPLENAIENTMINYVVSEFLFRNNSDGSTHKKLYEQSKDDILKYINRRTKLKRSYKLY